MQNNSSPTFPVVSMGKFTLLYFGTMGFYSLYWFYRNWNAAEAITGRNLFKIGRTLFAMFFVHQLFALVQTQQKTQAQQHAWQPFKLAWVYIGAGAIQFFLTLVVEQYGLSPWLRLFVFCAALVVQYYVLYTAQLVMNRVALDPYGNANSKLNIHNHLWIAFGFYLWFNTIYVCYLEATGQLPPPPASSPAPSSAVRPPPMA